MNFKTGMIACAVLALIPVLVWAATGRHWATRYVCQSTACETAADCKSQDDDSDWDCKVKEGAGQQCFDKEFEVFMTIDQAPDRDCFEFGLTPSSLHDGVLPLSGTFGGLAVLFFVLGRRRPSVS